MTQTREIVVSELPNGELTTDHFNLRNRDLPAPGPGEVLIRVILMSIDAANRAWMQGATYREAVKIGDVMHTYAIAEVCQSNCANFAVGDIVAAETGWAEYAVVSGTRVSSLPNHRPLAQLLSVFGIAGKTAYHGLLSVGRPVAGETVVVSAAAGSVGMYVGQIARALGCRTVGIAGGSEKCNWVRTRLGFDACIDYRSPGFFRDLRSACPQGVDVYFDNVGGQVLETVLFQMNMKGRVVCCGTVSQYNETAASGPRNLPGIVVVKRLRMEGFIVMDFEDQDERAIAELSTWLQAGKITVIDDIIDGLEHAPAALIGLLRGDNRGKRMIRVSADPG